MKILIFIGLMFLLISLSCDNPTSSPFADCEKGYSRCGHPRDSFCCPSGYNWTGMGKNDSLCYQTKEDCQSKYFVCVQCG